jgi:hypothetical protein
MPYRWKSRNGSLSSWFWLFVLLVLVSLFGRACTEDQLRAEERKCKSQPGMVWVKTYKVADYDTTYACIDVRGVK